MALPTLAAVQTQRVDVPHAVKRRDWLHSEARCLSGGLHLLQTSDPKTAASAHAARRGRAARAQGAANGEGPHPAGYLFCTGSGTAISASNMLRSSFFHLRACGHSDAANSLMVQAGVRPKDVQAILRHSKVSTTMDLYVHSYDEDLRAPVGKLGAAIG